METRQLRRAAERQVRKEATRAEINRKNAQHSTGPKTPEGKAASSANSWKHGLYSKQLVMPCEDPAELGALKADLRADHQPANTVEETPDQRNRRAPLAHPPLPPHGSRHLQPVRRSRRRARPAQSHRHAPLQKDRGFVPHSKESAPKTDNCELPSETENCAAPSGNSAGFVPQFSETAAPYSLPTPDELWADAVKHGDADPNGTELRDFVESAFGLRDPLKRNAS